MKKAIIIGASSGIGMQLARMMSADGYILGLAGRRTELLEKLKSELPCEAYTKYMDISNTQDSMNSLDELINEMGSVDLVFLSAGIGHINHDLEWQLEQETIDINVSGATAIINTTMKYFINKGVGHLAVMSSVASLRGGYDGPAYAASKAYLSNYVEGIRCKVKKQNLGIISITDVKAGLIDTDMAKGEGLFWVMPLEKATKQIYNALLKKKDEVYVTKRWGIMAFILKRVPKSLYHKI